MDEIECIDRGESLRKAFSLRKALASSAGSIRQVNCPEKINREVLEEFKNRSRPINLITPGKAVWSSRVIYFDNEHLFVRVPAYFESEIGSLLLVEFPTDDEAYVIQTFINKIKSPILCLKFQDPRKDPRHVPAGRTPVRYAPVDDDEEWLTEESTFVLRTTGGSGGGFSVREKVGRYRGEDGDGNKLFTVMEQHTRRLTSAMREVELGDLSLGGCSIVEVSEMERGSILYLSIRIDNVDYRFQALELDLFGIVRNVIPVDEVRFRYGVSFLKRLDSDGLNEFLSRWSGRRP